jgi:hypothetical protein
MTVPSVIFLQRVQNIAIAPAIRLIPVPGMCKPHSLQRAGAADNMATPRGFQLCVFSVLPIPFLLPDRFADGGKVICATGAIIRHT